MLYDKCIENYLWSYPYRLRVECCPLMTTWALILQNSPNKSVILSVNARVALMTTWSLSSYFTFKSNISEKCKMNNDIQIKHTNKVPVNIYMHDKT